MRKLIFLYGVRVLNTTDIVVFKYGHGLWKGRDLEIGDPYGGIGSINFCVAKITDDSVIFSNEKEAYSNYDLDNLNQAMIKLSGWKLIKTGDSFDEFL